MRFPDIPLRARPVLVGLAFAGLLAVLAVGPVLGAIEAEGQITAARERLARAREAAARPPQRAPLAGLDTDALLDGFRARLEALASERAAVIDAATVEPDPARPTLPRLQADLRGTTEGLYGLLHALESEAPLVAVEEADLSVLRAADAETARPTVMRARLTARGVLLPSKKPDAPGRTP